MRHTIMIAFPLAGLTLISAAGASVAHAETTTCAGRIWAVTLDNIVIQDGIACTSQGTCPQRTIYVMTRVVSGNTAPRGWEAVALAGSFVDVDNANTIGFGGSAGVVGFAPGPTDDIAPRPPADPTPGAPPPPMGALAPPIPPAEPLPPRVAPSPPLSPGPQPTPPPGVRSTPDPRPTPPQPDSMPLPAPLIPRDPVPPIDSV